MSSLMLDLPFITEHLPGIGGKIRAKPELFEVWEIPSYEPLGNGDHIYLNITKELITTRGAQLMLAELFSLKREDVGHAGLKDKNARTTQTFSLLLPRVNEDEIPQIIESNLGWKVNWISRHPKKLRSGHLNGNKFRVTITEPNIPMEEALINAKAICKEIEVHGVPNFYGVQRTGKDAKNVKAGLDLIEGRYCEQNRWLRRLLIGSYLSYLCNLYLINRIKMGAFTHLILGDIAKKHDTGGVFWVDDLEAEQLRFQTHEISYTAPIYGYKMRWPKKESKILEEELLASSSLTDKAMKQNKLTGTRRLGRLLPEININTNPMGLTLNFELPAGGYATTVIREFTKNNEFFQEEIEPLKE